MPSLGRDLAFEVDPIFAMVNGAATAGGAGDDTANNGASIRKSLLDHRYECLSFAISARAVLAATKTLSLAAKVEHSANGSSWTTLEDFGTAISLLGGVGGTTETGEAIISVNLNEANDYVRLVLTPDLSASGTDTATFAAVGLLSGADARP